MLMPADVPVHRPSVGAMSVTSGSQMPDTTRFYIYRGTGEDQFPETPEPVKPESVKRRLDHYGVRWK